MKYIFVRHGKTHFNEIQLKQGWCASPLTKQGIKEIENMAEQLKDYTIDAAYTSPILRAKHTAQMITVWIQAAFRLSYSIACVIVDLLSAQIRNDSLPLSETKSDAIP